MMTPSGHTAPVEAERYDDVIFDDRIRAFHGCDFFNVGFWQGISPRSALGIPQASRALVDLHLEREPQSAKGAGLSVLDIGCGLGATTRVFADFYGAAQVVGGNYSARQIDYARQTHPDLTFQVIDATDLPFGTATLDRVHAVEAAFHFEPRQTFIAEAARVLKPGGRLILTDLLYRRSPGLPACNSLRSIADYQALIESCGFRTLDLRNIREETSEAYRVLLAEAGYPQMGRSLGLVFAYSLGVFERSGT